MRLKRLIELQDQSNAETLARLTRKPRRNRIRRFIVRFRSAITGQYTTRADAEAHPSTTVRETHEVTITGDRDAECPEPDDPARA